MSRALLLFVTALMIGATCVSSPGALAPVVGAALALVGAGGVSSSSDVSETSSRSKVSSSAGAGQTGAGARAGAGRTGAGRALD